MDIRRPKTLLYRLGVKSEKARPLRVVSLHDHKMYHAFVREALQAAAESDGGGWVICLDGHTARELNSLERLLPKIRRIILHGDTSDFPKGADCTDLIPKDERLNDNDHFFLLLSSAVAILLLGALDDTAEDKGLLFEGEWTTQQHLILSFANSLLGESTEALLGSMVDPTRERPASHDLALDLTTLQVGAAARESRHIARDKDDLFSVLDILKAISSKRRAHDVLYVFVEQIARVVDTDRCSIVRVWGGENTGHVLASHEDESVQEHTIDLTKYPELSEALSSRDTVNIPDVACHSLTCGIAKTLKKANIASLLVIPIVLFDEEIGSLFLRAARSRGAFTRRDTSFFEIVAEAASSALERAQLFENIQRANERLARLAKTDGLTGLYNYRHFRDRLEEEFKRSVRYHIPLSCMIFDVDDFKNLNDTYGHLAGDSILREISQRTLLQIRTIDFVARYGGEEFVVIMPQTGLAGAKVEAERLCEAISAAPFDACGTKTGVSVSIGVATLDMENMKDMDAFVRAADKALYGAKHTGKNRVVAQPLPDKS